MDVVFLRVILQEKLLKIQIKHLAKYSVYELNKCRYFLTHQSYFPGKIIQVLHVAQVMTKFKKHYYELCISLPLPLKYLYLIE